MKGDILLRLAEGDADGMSPTVVMGGEAMTWHLFMGLVGELGRDGFVVRASVRTKAHGPWRPYVHPKNARFIYALTERGYRMAKTYATVKRALAGNGKA